jgi:1-acyl-sn-glycerol-3-phosphate acyltransferase
MSETAPRIPEKPHVNVVYKASHALAHFVATFALGLRVYGRHHVPRTGGALIASNHQSYLDPILVGVKLPRQLSFIAKSGLFKNRLFAWYISALGAFPIRQGAGDVGAMKESIRRVQEGHVLHIFPEGTRTLTGELDEIQPGIELLVRRAGVPVIPTAIAGAFEAWPPQKKLPKLYGPIVVQYGPALRLEGLKGPAVTALLDRTLRNLLAEARAKRAELIENG